MARVKAPSKYSTGGVAPKYQHTSQSGCKVPSKKPQLENDINSEGQEVSDTDTSYNDASSGNDEHDDSSEDYGHNADRSIRNNKRQRVDDEDDEDKLNSIIAKRDGLKVEAIVSQLVLNSGVKRYLVKWVGYSWVLEHELSGNDNIVLEGYICQQRSLRPRMNKQQRMADS
ncbi:hypothetical protein LTR56_027359 [Elasticomyces elasticus]|nr:hypothetical protein LTR22_027902 [Elasticomyces elasticus]KAK3614279.1 hypothetical protein LTR56_027359 [Elasticomyces elasticus]KAK4895981.1 hypothetical protein LTR49_028209 [Elasticomyces elasticus]KAK5729523.1 hypothetical protein LTS12_027333 [Elasticomyces elasticus]